ncbi:hypothetical protein NDU88_005036 [Pleurodeles waltl]|uniref:Uncharacterized protein n=1 Tax=Pleurodeles waltl TaxID=8319 RepID=A0AAV7VKD0_PLEWA|nr:hypothetical protein NDU88_005036 [Pleurodeles waltl]
MNAVSVCDHMGAQAFTEHARAVSGSKHAQPPLEKGGELAAVGGKERTLGGASKMAASFYADTWSRGTLEKRQLGATSKMAAPIHINEEDVVVISDEEEEVQPSTSRGAGGGLYRVEEELLDYDDDVDEEVLSMQRGDVTKSGVVPRVVQGDHSGAHHQELVAGNLPRGEEGLLGLLGSKEVRDVLGGTLQKGVQNFRGGLNEQTLSKVDASIQIKTCLELTVNLWVHYFIPSGEDCPGAGTWDRRAKDTNAGEAVDNMTG